ncbi:MAG: murein biosynthesis integral membrane protein MurJ [Burkholderiaceae bacterium]|jgi:putative peptidoglycan lipid II flippase|nr:murein biosynthesis integral membrane protein MurJ [Burkholderiaceae bacterium]
MNLLKTLLTISGMTMLSRITGLIRELLVARTFGASGFTDAFFVAFRIPNLLRRLFAEGAFSQAFVPILAEYVNRKGESDARELIDKVASALFWVLLLVTLAGVVGAPVVVFFVATGFRTEPAVLSGAVVMTRIMFPYILFMSLVSLAGGILNTWREFRVPAFTPVLLNLSLIVATLFVAPRMDVPIYALALAVFVGGLLQLAFQIPMLLKLGVLPRIHFSIVAVWRHEGVRRVIRQMLPATFAVSVAQISLLINTNIASHLASGSVSWLSYADRLMEFPNALLGVALGTILLPGLSRANARHDMQEYSSLLDWGLRLCFLLALPAGVLLITLSAPFTATLFHYGHFNVQDVAMTAHAVIAYGIGLAGMIVVRILAPGFYARQDIKTPVRIALLVLVATQAMNLLFVPWFAHAGLALSIGFGGCINAALLFAGLRWRRIYLPHAGWRFFFLRLGGALFLLAGVALWMASRFDWTGMHTQPFMRVCALATIMVVCGVVYFGALLLMGFRLRDFKQLSR